MGVEKTGERFGQIGALDAVLGDPEPREHGLVELAADARRGVEVETMCVGAERQRFVDGRQHHISLDLAAVDDLPRTVDLSADALLLGLEEVERDGIGVAGLQELLSLVVKVLHASSLAVQFALVAGLVSLYGARDMGANLGNLSLAELYLLPPVGNCDLNVSDQHGP